MLSQVQHHRDMGDTNPSKNAAKPLHSRLAGVALVTLPTALAVPLYCLLLWWFASHFDTNKNDIKDGFILLLIPSALTFHILRLARVGQSLMAPDAVALLARDQRLPVVYLRPFEEDAREISDDPEGLRIGGIEVTHSYNRRASKEENIAQLLRSLGPLVAVGRPGDRLAPLGAARLYLRDDEWQTKMRRFVADAVAVVIRPEASSGIKFELALVARTVDPRRVLMLTPDRHFQSSAYERMRGLVRESLGVSLPIDGPFDAFMFDARGEPVALLIEGLPYLYGDALRFVDQVRGLASNGAGAAGWPSPGALEAAELKVGKTGAAATTPNLKMGQSVANPGTPRTAGGADFVEKLRRRSNWAQLPRNLVSFGGAAFATALAGAATRANLHNREMTKAVVTAGICLAAVIWLAYVLERMVARMTLRHHPLGRALAASGDMEAVRESVDADFAGRTLDHVSLQIGHHWLCYASAKDAMVQPIDAAVWAYHEQVRIDNAYRSQLVLWTRNGIAYALPMSEHEVASSIEQLSHAAPWMIFGYSMELKDLWNLDRYDFIDRVDRRRIEGQSSSRSMSASTILES
jgi:hypothetical protein